MSDKGSVFQKGGGGTNFEQFIQTAFLTTLIIRGNVPCLDSSQLMEVAFQVTNRGYETDDLLVLAKSTDGEEHRLLFQIKHDISFTLKNTIFKEVITAFWKDYNNTSIFDKTKDKLIIAKNGLTKDERNHLKSLFNWANNHSNEIDFISEVNRIKGKKARLDVFRSVLKEANNNTDLNDIELWNFLKCLDVLEYDFLNEGSIDKTYFLNLIKLIKNTDSTSTEIEIWDSIFAYAAILNKDGGSATIESLKDKGFYQHFNNAKLSPYFKAIEKLKSDSIAILRPIKTTIGKSPNELRIPRTETREKLLEGLASSQFTIVTGKPGVGKSSEIKGFLQNNFSNASIFIFRADQFNEPILANVFSSQGVSETIYDIFSCVSLIPEKIIFIDSLEKLLEADPECAFKQFLALIKEHPEIKVIASSRKYAIDLINIKFEIDKQETSIVEIPTLNESELKIVSEKFPQLNSILKNGKIKKLLQSPKYLDFSISAISKTDDNYDNISLTEFKDKLWNSLIVDSTNTKNGLPIKREEAFKEIALKRAKEMKLFTKPDKSDAEAISYLENDEIIFQENQNRKYSPAHDILEDWALVKYVSSVFDDFPKPKELFYNLGNEPAIRRAFRLWVEDYLIENNSKIFELIRATILDDTIGKYWSDELLVAVFKSENSSSFFTCFETELLTDDATFFNRCLHIIKTCCKESNHETTSSHLLLPSGSAWKEALFFITNHIAQLELIKHSILNFLEDWYYKLLLQYNKIENVELQTVKSIVLIYLKEIEENKEFWQEKTAENKSENLISILFDLASLSKEEITQLISRAFIKIEDDNSWRLNSFYRSVIKASLSGIGNQRLIKELPELIIETAYKSWKYIPPKKEDYSDSDFRFSSFHSSSEEERWGLKDKHSFFPSGIYKTPVYNLLLFHPIIGLKFLIDLINYSIEFYVNNRSEYKHEISSIEIELDNGTITKLYAAWELWGAYRGMSVTHYCLESLLMTFEKFLLDTAKKESDISKENLKWIYDYVLKNSNNIAPLSVLTSIAIAYPNEIEESMLPLLSVKEFYNWDSRRVFEESNTLSPIDHNISFAQKERSKLNRLPHRKEFHQGLSGFIINHQLNNGTLNKQIHIEFDKFYKKMKADDLFWEKRLYEIDIRKWEVKQDEKKSDVYIVQPKYEKEVTEHLASKKDDIEVYNVASKYSLLITEAYEKKKSIDYIEWKKCYAYYSNNENIDLILNRPVTLAVLGLNEFPKNLSKEEKDWAIEIITEAISSIVQNTLSMDFGLNLKVSLLEKKIALSSFHLLMSNINDNEDKNGIIAIMTYMLFAPFQDYEMREISQYISEVFFDHFPNEGKRVWLGLINYSIYKKTNLKPYRTQDQESLSISNKEEQEFVLKISSDEKIKLDLSDISLEKSDSHLLARAFVITPFNSVDKDFSGFSNHFLSIVINDLSKKEDYSNNKSRESRQFERNVISDIEQYLSSLFLNSNFSFSKPVLTQLVNSLSNHEQSQRFYEKDLLEFVKSTLTFFVLKLYDNSNSKDVEKKHNEQKTNFWNLWEVLFDLIPTKDNHPLIPELMLDVNSLFSSDFQGNPNENDWNALNGKKEFYNKIFIEKEHVKTSSAINLFSTIGGKEFLPEGISWLTKVFKRDLTSSFALTSRSSERLIKRLFYNHISEIKNDKILIDDYLWILNRMVDLGSSQAYFFRENVITYKSNE